MKTVFRIAALFIALKCLPPRKCPMLVGMTCHTALIISNKHCIMIFPVLIDHPAFYKFSQDRPADSSGCCKVGKRPPHFCIFLRQGKWLSFFPAFSLFTDIRITDFSLLSIQKHCHRIRKIFPIKHFYKIDSSSALLDRMVIPLVSPHRDAMVAGKTFFPA